MHDPTPGIPITMDRGWTGMLCALAEENEPLPDLHSPNNLAMMLRWISDVPA
jgi:hypothetical protein